jgi:predicted permease
MRILRWLADLGEDIRFGVRSLVKTPRWSTTVVLTLAVGIGLTTAIFSVVYGVLLRPLPYRDQGRLVAIWMTSSSAPRLNVSPAFWRDLRESAQSFEDISLTRPVANFNLTGYGRAERLQGARTSWNLANTLGIEPLLGRWFTEGETRPGVNVAVLSYGLWERRFGADPALVGQTLELNGNAFEVIGIMPASFRYPTREFELWTPLYIPAETFQSGVDNSYLSVARLKPSVTIDRAQSEVALIGRHSAASRGVLGDVSGRLEPLLGSDVMDVRRPLHVLMAAAGCLLLVGGLNLALLLIGRGAARRREMAVRAALGASSGRLVRQLIAEALPIACMGAAGGLLLSVSMLRVLLQWMPPTMPRIESIGLHAPVVIFAIAASTAVVLGAALWPARKASHSTLQPGLQGMSRGVTRTVSGQGTLVVTQVAVTMVVLFAGALFARSAAALLRVDLGFEPQRVLTMHLAVTRAKYPTDAEVSDYYRRLEDRIRTLPGVLAAGFVNRLPLSGTVQVNPVQFERRPDVGSVAIDSRSATPGYFEAMGIPVRGGRGFQDSDRASSTRVGLIDEALARRVFRDESPIGQRFRIGADAPWVEVVGVVGHIRHDGPQLDERSQVYLPQTQRTQDRAALVVKASGPPATLTAAVIEQIHQENPEQPVFDVRLLEEWRNRTVHPQRLLSALVSLFGIAALLLASFGLYGVVSYATSLRMREFAIRMALGAESSDLRRLVFGHAGRLALTGLVIGAALAIPVGRAVEGLLFQVSGTDVTALVVAGLSLLAVCVMAAAPAGRQATRSDPALALRSE